MIILALIALTLVGIGCHGLLTYNRFARLRIEADQAWANLKTELERRLDVMAAMVDLAREYTAHEGGTQVSVANARAALSEAHTPLQASSAAAAIDVSSHSIVALSERYPKLKADRRYGAAQEEMRASSERVTARRVYFNQIVSTYNTALVTFPRMIWARAMGAQPRELYGDDVRGQQAGPRFGPIDPKPALTPGQESLPQVAEQALSGGG